MFSGVYYLCSTHATKEYFVVIFPVLTELFGGYCSTDFVSNLPHSLIFSRPWTAFSGRHLVLTKLLLFAAVDWVSKAMFSRGLKSNHDCSLKLWEFISQLHKSLYARAILVGLDKVVICGYCR